MIATADNFGTKLIAATVATTGHALYLLYKFVRHGRVNDISVGLLVFMAVVTAIGWIAYWRLSRAARRADG
jgi:hypothetical protein